MTIHGIVNGRHPYKVERIGNMTPVYFSEDPLNILHNCYRQILLMTFKEKKELLEQLVSETSVLFKKYGGLTAHDLAKFYRSIFRMECTTREGWAVELIETILGAGYARESVLSEVKEVMGVDGNSLSRWIPNGHVIRLH